MNYVIEFIKTVFPDTTIAFLFIAIIVFALWMYKELRSSHVESNKNNIQRADKAIDCYSELELEILKFFNNRSDFFNVSEKISKASSLMPYVLLKKCYEFKDESEDEKKNELLRDIHVKIKSEIISLKFKQNDPISSKSDDNVMDFVDNYMKTKVAPFVFPLIQTIFNLMLLLIIASFTIIIVKEPLVSQRVLYISLIFVAILYTILINILLSAIIMKGRFKHSFLNWLLFSLFAIITPSFIFVGSWYRGLILIVLIFAYAIYSSKKSIKSSTA